MPLLTIPQSEKSKRFSFYPAWVVPFLLLLYTAVLAGIHSTLLMVLGMMLGFFFVKGSIGFTVAWRRFIVLKDPSGMFLQFVLLAAGMFLFVPTLSIYESLAPAAGPVSVSVLIGAFCFGFFMQIANGCGSGIVVSAGSGNQTVFVFFSFAIGAFLGTFHLSWWLSLGSLGEIVLYQKLGSFSALIIQSFFLILLALAVYMRCKKTPYDLWKYQGKKPWLYMVLIAMVSYSILLISATPWGIVYGLGLWVAKIFFAFGLPITDIAFWSQSTTQSTLQNSILLDHTSLTTIGFMIGAWAISYSTKAKLQSDLQVKRSDSLQRRKKMFNILGALGAGYFSRVAFGCNIGALYSGIISSSLHGWLWFAAAFLGSTLAVRMRPFCGMLNP